MAPAPVWTPCGANKTWARFALIGAGLMLCGCPRVCGDPEKAQLELAGNDDDPSLGTFKGQLSWLQTSEESTLEISLRTADEFATSHCGDPFFASLSVTVQTEDGVLDATTISRGRFGTDGFLIAPTSAVPLEVERLVAANKIPGAPDILARGPSAYLTLTATAKSVYEATIQVRSSTDHLHIALAALERTGAP